MKTIKEEKKAEWKLVKWGYASFNEYWELVEEWKMEKKAEYKTATETEIQIENRNIKRIAELEEENRKLKDKLSEITMVADDEKQSIEHILELEEENKKLKKENKELKEAMKELNNYNKFRIQENEKLKEEIKLFNESELEDFLLSNIVIKDE